MTDAELDLMDADYLDVDGVSDAAQLVQRLQNSYAQADDDMPGGFVWWFQSGPYEGSGSPGLMLGVRGDVGSVHWYHGPEALIPVDGVNEGWVDYWTSSGHMAPTPPGTELPIARVYEALAEFVRTRQRPTCITWRPEPQWFA